MPESQPRTSLKRLLTADGSDHIRITVRAVAEWVERRIRIFGRQRAVEGGKVDLVENSDILAVG
jgi:hypothetical protein